MPDNWNCHDCPSCGAENWVCLGDPLDVTRPDPDPATRCHACQTPWIDPERREYLEADAVELELLDVGPDGSYPTLDDWLKSDDVEAEDGLPTPHFGTPATQREDQRPATYEHIHLVHQLLNLCVRNLLKRSEMHDQSKLHDPERAIFDEFSPRLREITYGSEEYDQCLEQMRPALEHHYAHNAHHPEFHDDGILGMSLIDLLEMLMDWKAASLRHADGDVRRSVEINQKRFGYSDGLKRIFLNTLAWLDQPTVVPNPETEEPE